MRESMINHPKLIVNLKTGSEGPRHDPYSYEELEVKVPGRGPIVLHLGLANWLKVDGRKINGDMSMTLFTIFTGYTLPQIWRIYRKLQSRCHECGGTDFTEETGFPGEYFRVCSNCNHIQSGYFNESEII